MAKGKKESIFFCNNCGNESSKWMGQCPACHEWNTFVEEPVVKIAGATKARVSISDRVITPINEISINGSDRCKTGMGELDRVLGGGLVKGSLILVGGDPGIGKSTLLLQVLRNLAAQGKKVLYISGEESLQQIKLRGDRIGEFSNNLSLLCETSLEIIEEILNREKPDVLVIDSIQTMYGENVASAPGSVSQVREATNTFLRLSKGLSITTFLVGHVTKEGAVAGPRVLEHMVDTVLYFEGDRHASYRLLRGVKNRFGSTNEVGVFEMMDKGLREVLNPSEYMLDGRPDNASGSVVACSMEGSRPILLEVQALVSKSNLGVPRRTTVGADINRVNQLMAVLEKRAKVPLLSCDGYINIAGGLKMSEPAVDLAIIFAIYSSYRDIPLDRETMVFGEVGLSGEVRTVSMAEQRVREGEKLGFKRCILPKGNLKSIKAPQGMELIGMESVLELGGFFK